MNNYTAMDVANYIINYVNSDNKKLCTLSHLKLQKLLYYVQATYLAKNDGVAIFTNDIEKWQYGPVVREVYYEFKDFGISHINTPRSYLKKTISGGFELISFNSNLIDSNSNISDHIKSVVNSLKDLDAFSLVEKTHAEPMWSDLKHEILSRNNILKYSLDEMKTYFKAHPL